MEVNALPDATELSLLLKYDRATGTLYWRPRLPSQFEEKGHSREHAAAVWNAKFAGKPALACVDGKGYLHGRIHGKCYRAHRVIWKMLHGSEPEQIDHEDGNRTNNRPINLRPADNQANSKNACIGKNNRSGHLGVHFDKVTGRWVARLKHDGKNVWLGRHRTIDQAIAARDAASPRFGFHPNHGRPA